MAELDYLQLSKSVRDIFTNQSKYSFDKHVAEFKIDGKYVGDVFNMNILEPKDGEPPIIYHNASPFETVTKTAPDYAMIFQGGKLLHQTEITEYIPQRTGVMTSIVLGVLGVDSLVDKEILFVGTGRIATCDLTALKQHYPDTVRVEYINNGSEPTAFSARAQELNIDISKGSLVDIGKYDLIVCHTNSAEPVLTTVMQSQIKEGAVITAFVSEDFQEVAPEYYDATQANVIIDWDKTISDSPDLQSAVDNKLIEDAGIIRLKDLISGDIELEPKKYTIYRSHGTPMQNLAFLKLLYTS